jgi:hypothetical protein
MTKMVWIPVPRLLLAFLGLGLVAVIVKETPPVMRELKILRM